MPTEIVSIALALVLGWWTARLARNKGRKSFWFWGAAAFILTLPGEPWRLLGMAPLFILLFLRSPLPRVDAPPKELTCARCKTNHTASQRYCISCGWELAKPYPETQAIEPSEEMGQAVSEEPAVTAPEPGPPQEVPAAAVIPTPGSAPTPAPEPAAAPEPALASQEVSPEDQPGIPGPEAAEAESAPQTPVFRGQPTAANMTERGIWLFNQGRIQESIDQFTKALALDVNFKEAWEHRAEAYSRLGRGEQAAEDRRRLQAIIAGSSSP